MANRLARVEWWALVDQLKARGRPDRPMNQPAPPPPVPLYGSRPYGEGPYGG